MPSLPRPGARAQRYLGAGVGILLLWFCTVAWYVPSYMSTENFHSVFIYDGCIGTGTVTVFTFCMLEVVVAAWFLRRYFAPTLFSDEVWQKFDPLKQQKIVGFIAQIVVRAAVMVQLFKDVWPAFNFEDGLLSSFNAKVAYAQMKADGQAVSCATAGMNAADVTAMRSWVFAKYHMTAVHLWELAFIPGLSIDGWLHHLFVVLVATVSSQPETLTGNPEVQPYVDSVGFILIVGASLNWMVKVCVVMYHYTAPSHHTQANWMQASVVGAVLITAVFYTGIPLYIGWRHAPEFGTTVLITMVICPVIFLAVVETRLFLIKQSIVRNSRSKANRDADGKEAIETELNRVQEMLQAAFDDRDMKMAAELAEKEKDLKERLTKAVQEETSAYSGEQEAAVEMGAGEVDRDQLGDLKPASAASSPHRTSRLSSNEAGVSFTRTWDPALHLVMSASVQSFHEAQC